MQVQQIIQASADVITITSLRPGDVYKRVGESGYQGEPTLRFGVVQSVMNNGTDAAVVALEYERDYSTGVTVAMKVFNGGKPAALFPATPAEVTAHLDDLQQAAERKVTEAAAALAKAQEAAAVVADVRSQVGALTAPATAAGVIEATEVEAR